jgi:hypothetical protein
MLKKRKVYIGVTTTIFVVLIGGWFEDFCIYMITSFSPAGPSQGGSARVLKIKGGHSFSPLFPQQACFGRSARVLITYNGECNEASRSF